MHVATTNFAEKTGLNKHEAKHNISKTTSCSWAGTAKNVTCQPVREKPVAAKGLATPKVQCPGHLVAFPHLRTRISPRPWHVGWYTNMSRVWVPMLCNLFPLQLRQLQPAKLDGVVQARQLVAHQGFALAWQGFPRQEPGNSFCTPRSSKPVPFEEIENM